MGINWLALIISSVFLAACGGSGSSDSENESMEEQVVDERYDLSNGQTNINDTYEIPEAESVVADTSTEAGEQWAHRFTLTQDTNINQVSFTGIVLGELNQSLKLATFVITLLDASPEDPDLPDDANVTEVIVQADAKFVTTISETSALYTFNVNQENLFNVTQGEYFLSIADTGAEGFTFQWAREPSENLSKGLTGGASRLSIDDPWQAEQWGRNVRIAGTCPNTCIIDGQTKGSISAETSEYELEAGILDADASNPIYFMGVYEGDVEGEVSVVVNEQGPSEVTLVLSSYNATAWKLSGEGIDKVTQIYVLGYQAGSVSGHAQTSNVDSYSFDDGNYLGTLSEWPDAESTELSEQSKQDTLDTIEAVTGKVTSYGVIYSTNGFEVY